MSVFRRYISSLYLKGNHVGRNIDLRESDVFLVSYPSSGGTWLRFLLANMLTDNVTSSKVDRVVPSIYTSDHYLLESIKNKRYLYSNEYFDPRYYHVLYLVRDPRCVVLSDYAESIKAGLIDKNQTLHDFVKDFVSGKVNLFGTWGEHVESWCHLKKSLQKDFLLIRYEDLVDDFKHVLSKMLAFFNVNYNNELIEHAKKHSLFRGSSNRIQKKDCFNIKYPIGKDNPSCMGECWQLRLSEEDVRIIEQCFGDTMQKVGYALKFP
ncbi:MAG: sulfotransferase domain-containing protein [Bacteroidales bacterium]